MDRGAEGRRGREGEVYERGNEEGEGEDEDESIGEVAIKVWELGMIGRGIVGGRPLLEEGVDIGDEKESGAAAKSVLEDVSAHELKTNIATAPQASCPPLVCLTIPDSDTPSTILPSYNSDHGVTLEGCYSNTLDQQRRQRVRFDEALRMHSFGGSQYAGRVVDRDV